LVPRLSWKCFLSRSPSRWSSCKYFWADVHVM
jgi:hypothetical protein